MKLVKIRDNKDLKEKVIRVARVSKTVTGGRTMSFSVFTAAGDQQGNIGVGLGKALSVADAVKKGLSQAKKSLRRYSRKGNTIPHEVIGKFGATKVFMKPAPSGTGIVAGSSVRDLLDLLGVKDVFSKVIGSKNKVNVAYATLDGLSQLKTYTEIAAIRGKKV